MRPNRQQSNKIPRVTLIRMPWTETVNIRKTTWTSMCLRFNKRENYLCWKKKNGVMVSFQGDNSHPKNTNIRMFCSSTRILVNRWAHFVNRIHTWGWETVLCFFKKTFTPTAPNSKLPGLTISQSLVSALVFLCLFSLYLLLIKIK